jgi:heat shock protein HslJ
MKNKLILVVFIITIILPSCQKDWAENWIGTYTGVAGGTALNRIVVSKVDKKTLKMEFQTAYLGSYVTFATVANAKLSNSTTATISEDGMIAGYSDVYHFSGAATLNGNTLTLNGQAQSKTNSSDVKYYAFTGSK